MEADQHHRGDPQVAHPGAAELIPISSILVDVVPADAAAFVVSICPVERPGVGKHEKSVDVL